MADDKEKTFTTNKEKTYLPTTLYTTEANSSREKVEKELKVEDPTKERAEAAMSDSSKFVLSDIFKEEEEEDIDNDSHTG